MTYFILALQGRFRRWVLCAFAITASLALVAEPGIARDRFGGGHHGGGGGHHGGGFGGGGLGGGGSHFDHGGGGFDRQGGGGGFDQNRARQRKPDNVESRQEGRTDRTDSRQDGRTQRSQQRNETAQTRSYNRQQAWSDSVDHWHGYHYWGGHYGGASFATGMLLGMAVASLPPKHETVVVAGAPYYYVNGVYYAPAASGYTVVPAPVGASVEHPPAQVTNVYVNDEDLGYANGTYYKQEPAAKEGGDPSYKVVTPPVGATVQTLPKDAKPKTVDGTEYYEYADTYYQVFHSGSKVVYMVVKDPSA